MTLVREPNTYIRTIEILVHPLYVHLRFSSLQFNTQYTGKSSIVSLTVVHLSRRSRFFPSLLAVKDKSTSTRLTPSTSLLLSWFSREVLTCIHLEGIVVSYTFDFYLHNLWCPSVKLSDTVDREDQNNTGLCTKRGSKFTLGARQRNSKDRRTARSVYVKRVTPTVGASQSVAKTRRFTKRSQISAIGRPRDRRFQRL